MPNEASLHVLSDQERNWLTSQLVKELPTFRTKLGLSQDEFAGLLDISRQTYSSIETGKRKMSWTLFLSLILLLDNNSLTHEFLRNAGLFPQKIFQNTDLGIVDQVLASFNAPTDENIKKRLDNQALHVIETVIMMEYARCNNMSSEAVIKAFEGRRQARVSTQAVRAREALRAIKTGSEEK